MEWPRPSTTISFQPCGGSTTAPVPASNSGPRKERDQGLRVPVVPEGDEDLGGTTCSCPSRSLNRPSGRPSASCRPTSIIQPGLAPPAKTRVGTFGTQQLGRNDAPL